MPIYPFFSKNKKIFLALGAESEGNFCFFAQGKIHFSQKFGDLLEETNWQKYQQAVLDFLKKNKFKPDVILTDLHPLFRTTLWGEELAKKYRAKHIRVQHHHAHIFSAIGDRVVCDTSYVVPDTFYAVVMDGTGFGTDEKIWGGEVFKVKSKKLKVNSIERIGHLENQTLIGGDLAIREPARMLIGILNKIFCHPERSSYSDEVEGSTLKYRKQCHLAASSVTLLCAQNGNGAKNKIYHFIKNYYSKNEFELIHNQLQQNFNCLETSSTGRTLDAVSLLLGFCKNIRKYKHEPIDLLEKNSTKPYADIKPKITLSQGEQVLSTTFLFEYLIKNLHKDEARLAATAQLYIAKGLYEIIEKNIPTIGCQAPNTFITGGITNNKIISAYLISKGAYASNSIPRGDAGLSFGQVVYYLLYF